jgi:hypothetical protein
MASAVRTVPSMTLRINGNEVPLGTAHFRRPSPGTLQCQETIR